MIVPNAALLMLPFGARKFVRLSRLKNSARNSRLPLRHGIGSASTPQSPPATPSARDRRCVGALPNGWLGSVGAATPRPVEPVLHGALVLRHHHLADHVRPVVVGAAEVLLDAGHLEAAAGV